MKKLIVLGFAAVSAASNAYVLFDNMTDYEASVSGASVTATSSTPNTFMGDAYQLVGGASQITGFDLYPVNNSGTTFNALKINIFVWGTVNTGAVSASAPAFSSLLGSYTLTSTGTFTTGFFYTFESASPGVTPGVTLGTPINVGSAQQIGVTFNYQGSTDGGVTFASKNGLSSLIKYGTAPTLGSNVLGGTNGGYYRNASSETNGNFVSTYRSLGVPYQNLAFRAYGVPEPSSVMAIAIGGIALIARRRKA